MGSVGEELFRSEGLTSLDIETVCNVTSCKGFGDYKKCDHALDPWRGRITKIGVIGPDGLRTAFNSTNEFWYWYTNRSSRDYFVGHNFKFDYLWLRVHCNPAYFKDEQFAHCTQLMAYVLTEKIPEAWLEDYEIRRKELVAKGETWHRVAGKHSLKALAPYFLGVDPFWETDAKDDDEYVLKDAEYTLRLSAVLAEKLQTRGEWDFYVNKQLPYTKMILEAELEGAELDLEGLEALDKELRQKASVLEEQMDQQWAAAHHAYRALQDKRVATKYTEMAIKAGTRLAESPRYLALYRAAIKKVDNVRISYASPKQRLWLFQEYLGLDCTKFDIELNAETGRWEEVVKYSTDSEVVERLINQGHEELKVFADWSETNKILTTFLPSFRELQTDGVIHFIYNPDITNTGRLSSKNPNGQNIPKSLRPLFKSRKGKKFVGYDADQIEAKIIALYTNDGPLYKLINDGVSFHDNNVKVYFGYDTPIADVKKFHEKERYAVKSVGYSLFYNSGANRVNTVFTRHGFVFGKERCKEFVKNFREEYKQVFNVAAQITEHFESGEPFPNLFGRPLIVEKPSDCYMKSFNKVIQSSASDLCLQGSLNALNEMRVKGLNVKPIFFVHDFSGFEVDAAQAEQANEILVRNLIDFNLKSDHGLIKLSVDGGIMERWSK